MMCRIDNYAQSINTENNSDAAVGNDDEETVLLMMKLPPASGAPVPIASRLSFGPSSLSSSPPSSPHHGKPSLSNHSKLQSSNHSRQTVQIQRRCFFSTRFKIAVFLTILLEGICLWSSGIDMLQSVMVNLASSIGVMQYESNIYSEHFLSFLDTGIRPAYFPFLLHGNTLLCPRVYREFMLTDRPRIKAAIEMISAGLVMSQRDKTAKLKKNRDPLPILIRNGDGSHCNTTTPLDGDGSDFPGFNFPRLTWAVPALKYHVMGCQAVPIPSYETWMDYSKKHTSEESWDDTFALESKQYPWNNKTNVALWRGTTTANDMYFKWELNQIPRGRLVQMSMKHPELIDAGFVRLNQQFENATFTKENATILTDRMKFDDMMKYKAIIDIDGNDWSSRFPKLLCMNSVVIKVCVCCVCSSERIVFDGNWTQTLTCL